MCAPIDRVRREELTADRVEHVPIPPAAPTTSSAAGARAAGSEGSGRSRAPEFERPGWPSGAPIARGSTISTIAFWGRRGPHRSGRDCRIGRREAGREGCLWPDAASQGRPPDGSGLRGESIT